MSVLSVSSSLSQCPLNKKLFSLLLVLVKDPENCDYENKTTELTENTEDEEKKSLCSLW